MRRSESNAAAKLIAVGGTHFGDCESSCIVTGPSLTKLTCMPLEKSKAKWCSKENIRYNSWN